jgi:hypothetical protein
MKPVLKVISFQIVMWLLRGESAINPKATCADLQALEVKIEGEFFG